MPLRPESHDVLVCWNRYGTNERLAQIFEAAGAAVLVAENGYLGREFLGSYWYALARNHHNGAGAWAEGGPERWDSLGVRLKPWRQDGKHILVLPQRGIGPKGVAMPKDWPYRTVEALRKRTKRPVVLRPHPGENACKPLADDLHNALACVTWGSGAALKALVAGIPVFSAWPRWIGYGASAPFDSDIEAPFLGDRLPTFRRLSWAVWSVDELATGEPFRRLLCTS